MRSAAVFGPFCKAASSLATWSLATGIRGACRRDRRRRPCGARWGERCARESGVRPAARRPGARCRTVCDPDATGEASGKGRNRLSSKLPVRLRIFGDGLPPASLRSPVTGIGGRDRSCFRPPRHIPNPSKFFLIFAARTAASAFSSSSSAWIPRSAVLKSKLSSSSSSGATPT